MTATMTPSQVEQYRAFRRKGLATIREQQRAAADARFEDLEFMLDAGETPARAFRRLGIRRDSFTRLAERRGRHDLIARYRGAPE